MEVELNRLHKTMTVVHKCMREMKQYAWGIMGTAKKLPMPPTNLEAKIGFPIYKMGAAKAAFSLIPF